MATSLLVVQSQSVYICYNYSLFINFVIHTETKVRKPCTETIFTWSRTTKFFHLSWPYSRLGLFKIVALFSNKQEDNVLDLLFASKFSFPFISLRWRCMMNSVGTLQREFGQGLDAHVHAWFCRISFQAQKNWNFVKQNFRSPTLYKTPTFHGLRMNIWGIMVNSVSSKNIGLLTFQSIVKGVTALWT